MRVLISASFLLAHLAACGRPTTEPGADGAPPEDGKAKRTVIQNKGSDTLVNVAQAWAEAYKTVDPNVAIAVSGGGTGTGVSALINGTADLANASRKLKDSEYEQARAAGKDPKEFTVGYDALAIYLHKDNPLAEITVAKLADIYGEGGTIEKWSDLGVKVPGCDSDEIIRVSRQNNSGTYAYFQEQVLGDGREFKFGSRDMHGSKDVADLVVATPCAIGYSGLAYVTPELKAPCVKKSDAEACVAPSEAAAMDGSYPIARPLFMYTPAEPTGAVKAYLDWLLSDAGQCIIQDKGYSPVRTVSCG
jgi:phosphate transport system substrate-binding protein